ncbi:MAG TPA: hypothetical protein VGB37_15150 [Candidatus Lokiarchaeia archaeon]
MNEEFDLSEKKYLETYLKALGINDIEIKNILFIIESKEKEFIRLLKESLIFSRNKYGLDWCDQLWWKKVEEIAGEKLR